METPDTTESAVQSAPAAPVTPVTAKGPSPYLTPAAVVVGAVIIAFALMFGNSKAPNLQGDPNVAAAAALENIIPISREDHIRGNPDAVLKIVEYSDTECPFCKQFHSTLQRVVDEYGPSGTVAWVYRHFPLDGLHPNARAQAEATECAADIGGQNAFWAFLDRLMTSPQNTPITASALPGIAGDVGLDVEDFNACMQAKKYAGKVQSHVENAVATGGEGTPWNIIVTASGKKIPVSGALPYEMLKQMIDQALAEE